MRLFRSLFDRSPFDAGPSLAVLLLATAASVSHAATLPPSLLVGLQDALEGQWQGAQAAWEQRVLKYAGRLAPGQAGALAELAGQQAKLTSTAASSRDEHVRQHSALLADLAALDRAAAQAAESAEALAALRNAEQQARRRAGQVESLDAQAMQMRAAVVSAARDLEARVDALASQSDRYQSLAKAIDEGSHPKLRAAQKVRADFNAELEAQSARETRERNAHEQAARGFRDWVKQSEQALARAQADIDAAHSAWRDSRQAALAALPAGDGNTRADDADARETPVSEEERARLTARAEQARSALADAEQTGQALLARIQAEHAARQAVLADAGKALVTRHASERASIAVRRKAVQAQLTALTEGTRELLEDAKAVIEAGHRGLLEAYGADYAALHRVVAEWLRTGEVAGLNIAPAAVGAAGARMLEQARAANSAREQAATLNAELMALSARLSANATAHQQRESALESEREVLATRAAALESAYGSWHAPLASGRAALMEAFGALAKETPGLAPLAGAFDAGSGALSLLHRHLQASLPVTGDADGQLDGDRWPRVRDELRRRLALVDGFEAALQPLLETLASPVSGPAAANPTVDVPSQWVSAVQTVGGTGQFAEDFYRYLTGRALAAWSLPVEPGVWRFVDAPYVEQSGAFVKR